MKDRIPQIFTKRILQIAKVNNPSKKQENVHKKFKAIYIIKKNKQWKNSKPFSPLVMHSSALNPPNADASR